MTDNQLTILAQIQQIMDCVAHIHSDLVQTGDYLRQMRACLDEMRADLEETRRSAVVI